MQDRGGGDESVGGVFRQAGEVQRADGRTAVQRSSIKLRYLRPSRRSDAPSHKRTCVSSRIT